MTQWLDRHDSWATARARFSASIADHLSFGPDRLIRSANMFDIIPKSAGPIDDAISEELSAATNETRQIFSALPDSPDRSSLLSALGRIGKSTLKRKVRHRAKLVVDVIGDHFPDLYTVADKAVDCRNYFVHGGDERANYANRTGDVIFFTDTLEFIFGASDLIEAGWDANTWSKAGTTMEHPFTRYRVTYGERLERLKKVIS